MLAGQIEIQLLANIARLSKDMNEAKRAVGGAMDSIEKSVDRAKMAFGGLAGMLGARELIRMTDEYTKFTAQLRLATTGISEYAIAYANVKRISKDAQAELGATGILYARISNGTRELGISQGRVTDITETVSLALKASGATAQESASAMLQLSQAFGSGVLRGQEFNAVNEAAPRLMKALADGIGVPVGQLRAMAEAGKLTSAVMAEALPKALEDLRKEAASVQTISGAFIVLKNNVMEFVGQQAQASGAVSALTSGIGLLANNLETLAAVAIGLGVSKLAQVMIGVSAETYKATAGAMGYVAAQQAQRAATIASVQAELAKVESTLASAAVTKAAIVLAREETVAKLGLARSDIAVAQAAMAASSAAGAQSFALRVLKESTEQLTVAEARRAAMVTELAVLGQQQARVSAQITAATAAQAAAQTALGTATSASLGIMSRTLGLLGGPIGAITTLLGLGATAWALWGGSAKDAEGKASKAVEESTQDIITRLDEQIKKLKERNKLAAGGLAGIAQSTSPESTKMAELRGQMDRAQAGTNEFAGLGETARIDIVQKLGAQYGELYARIQAVNTEQAKLGEHGKQSKLDAWLAKNKTFLTDTEKLALAIKEAKAELGDAFSPDIEKRIRDEFGKKDAGKAVNESYRASIAMMEKNQALEKALLDGSLANQESYYKQGIISEEQFVLSKLDIKLQGISTQEEILRKEVDLATGKKDLAARERYIGELKVLEQGRLNAIQATENLILESRSATAKKEQDEAEKSIAAIYDQVLAVEKQVDAYDKLPSSLTRVSIARLNEQRAGLMQFDGSEEKLKLIDREIEAYGRLYAAQGSKESIDTTRKATEDAVKEAQKIVDNFRENIQRNLGDGLYNMLDGNFDNIGQSFKKMLLKMVADAAAADIMSALMGKGKGASGTALADLGAGFMKLIGTGGGYQGAAGADGMGSVADFMSMDAAASFDGGGFTGNGPRSGGMDGKGGFLAMMHPQETVVDHTKGQSGGGGKVINFSPTYNIQIDSRSDRAQIMKDMMRMKDATKAELMEEMDH